MIRNVMKAIDNIVMKISMKKDIYEETQTFIMNIFNSVQQLDSGRTWQAWQMSLQPMVQLSKKNAFGESGGQNNLHFGDH